MVAVREDHAAAASDTIDRARDTDLQALHPARECIVAVSFRDQVEVTSKDREMHEPEAEALGACFERSPHRSENG